MARWRILIFPSRCHEECAATGTSTRRSILLGRHIPSRSLHLPASATPTWPCSSTSTLPASTSTPSRRPTSFALMIPRWVVECTTRTIVDLKDRHSTNICRGRGKHSNIRPRIPCYQPAPRIFVLCHPVLKSCRRRRKPGAVRSLESLSVRFTRCSRSIDAISTRTVARFTLSSTPRALGQSSLAGSRPIGFVFPLCTLAPVFSLPQRRCTRETGDGRVRVKRLQRWV
ncbi:hypothetical protein C8R46DRAFT_1105092 [Mycena filopes]|nr:hypothetical protein C8R46DRAFT_1105092 [Mycena filopes]